MDTSLREEMLARAEALVNHLATWAHDHPDADFDAREALVLEAGRLLQREWLALVAGAAGRRTPACPHCGVRSVRAIRRRRTRTLQSRCGLVRIRRHLLSCRGCGRAWHPVDGVLKLPPKQRASAGVQRWEAWLGGCTTFAEGAKILAELTGIAVGTETLRTHAEQIGTELEGQAHARQAHVQAEQTPPPEQHRPAPGLLVIETDGVHVRYRDRHLDGTPITGEWHEVKLGLVAGWRDGALQEPTYVAAREPAARFAQRLGAEAACRGALDVVGWTAPAADGGGHVAQFRPVLILGDGAKWIWNEVAATYTQERTEIVDWYHASEHLWDLARTLHGPDAPATKPWAEHATHLLWQHGPRPLLDVLRATRPSSAEAERALRRERGYFTSNATRMQYRTVRRRGLPVGSGPVESEAKRLVQLRFKRPGMRWSDLGARAILQLRCHSLSGRSLQDLPLAS